MKKLQGSEKQVKWAEDIRNNFIKYTGEMLTLQKERATTGDTNRNRLEGRITAASMWYDYKRKLKEVQEDVLNPTREERAGMTKEEAAEAKKAAQIKRAGIILAWMEEVVKERLEEESAAVWIENRPR